MQKNNIKFGLDLLMFLGLLLIMVPKMLDQTVHEWAGLIIAGIFIIHIIFNWNWIKAVTVNFLRKPALRNRGKYILNLLIFAGFAATVVSGMFISKTIDFSWLGIARGHGVGWKLLHESASYLTFLLVGIHTGLSFNWVIGRFQAGFGRLRTVQNMKCKNKLIRIILIVSILLGGAYSFNYLSFISKANPARIVEAVQLFDQTGSAFQQGFRGPGPGSVTPSFGGQRGPGGRPGGHSGRENSGFNSFGKLLALLGVFASTLTGTYVIDQFMRNKKVLE